MKNKKVLIIVGVVILLVLIYIVCAATGNLKPAGEAQSEPATPPASSESDVEAVSFGWNSETAQTDEGTSARVDEILLQAGTCAEEMPEDEAEAAWDEALSYLKEHADNFFESSEVMEHSMYYGEFLYRYIEDNAAASDISELPESTRAAYDAGYNTVKSIRYVYRGAEAVEDESTQSALSEARAALDKFQ